MSDLTVKNTLGNSPIMRFLRICWNEWMGSGPLLGRGNFSEFLWATFGNTLIGALILALPKASIKSHGLALMLWRWPAWCVGAVFLAAGALSDVGLVVAFRRNDCVLSRLLRLAGASLGLWCWLCVLGSVLLEAQFSPLAFTTSLIAFLVLFRTVCLSWRRF